jgi:hypothetical protein
MNFYAFSLLAQKSLRKFQEYHLHSADSRARTLLEKTKRCGYQVLLVAPDPPIVIDDYPEGMDEQSLRALSDAWRSILATPSRQRAAQKEAWQVIEKISTGVPANQSHKSIVLRRLHQPSDADFYILLLTEDEPAGLPAHILLILCELWQLKQGRLTLHASGIRERDRLFLFLGSSGAGKSTIAKMSSRLGNQVIDQDRVLVHRLPGSGYSAYGWGYGIMECEIPLRAIFRLVQSTEDRLIPLNQRQVGHLILERHNEVMGGMQTEDLLRESFHQASDIARQVPGFELHFRKSPDFWKLIDAQFPD